LFGACAAKGSFELNTDYRITGDIGKKKPQPTRKPIGVMESLYDIPSFTPYPPEASAQDAEKKKAYQKLRIFLV
jgi:hypothetical protein